ncbi:MAG: terminase small subunit, partial [Alphaproteobacteria bacterium]
MTRKLTPKQNRLVALFLEIGNRAEAYRRTYDCSGMSVKTIRNRASEEFQKPHVAARLAELQAELARKHEVTADLVIAELASVAFADMGDFLSFDEDGEVRLDLSNLPPYATAAIKDLTQEVFTEGKGEDARQVRRTKLKLHAKIPALLELAKHTGVFQGEDEPPPDDSVRLYAEMPLEEVIARLASRVGPERLRAILARPEMDGGP